MWCFFTDTSVLSNMLSLPPAPWSLQKTQTFSVHKAVSCASALQDCEHLGFASLLLIGVKRMRLTSLRSSVPVVSTGWQLFIPQHCSREYSVDCPDCNNAANAGYSKSHLLLPKY